MEQHVRTVTTWTNWVDPRECQARCSCGWRGPFSHSKRAVLQSHCEHLREITTEEPTR